MYAKIYPAVKLLFGEKVGTNMHLCVLVFRFHICVCNSTPMCFLKKAGVQEKQKG